MVNDFQSWNVFTMLSLQTFHNIISQIMEIIGYARRVKKLDNVAYRLLNSFSANSVHILLASISFYHFNDVGHNLI